MLSSTIANDFPILSQPHPQGKRLVYLDSAATSQKPQAVLDALTRFYSFDNANVHRGVHFLGDRSTLRWHESRATIAKFFSARADQLVVTRNTTEALNFVAYSLESGIAAGEIIVGTQMEHHSNLVPWQELARRTGAKLELIPVTDQGELDLLWFEQFLALHGKQVKVVAFSHVSNTLGTINPVSRVVQAVRNLAPQALIALDAAQSAPHLPINFMDLGVDFMAVSAHKMLGPMGIGGVFVRPEHLSELAPWLFGGGMIGEVQDACSTFAEDPEDRFSAGTPDVAGMVGWAAACSYLEKLGMKNVFEHDQDLVSYALERLQMNPRVVIAGPLDPQKRCGSVAFVYDGAHSHDVAQILDSEGVAVRSGHHCTMPLHTKMGWAATTRLSFNVYTTREDIDVCVEALGKVDRVFRLGPTS